MPVGKKSSISWIRRSGQLRNANGGSRLLLGVAGVCFALVAGTAVAQSTHASSVLPPQRQIVAPAGLTVGKTVQDRSGATVAEIAEIRGTTAALRFAKGTVCLPVDALTSQNGALVTGFNADQLGMMVTEGIGKC